MTDKELDEFIYVGENKFIELAMIFGDAWASTAIQIAVEHRAMLTQEPVATMYVQPTRHRVISAEILDDSQVPDDEWFDVYTAPPKKEWVGLTDDDVNYCVDAIYKGFDMKPKDELEIEYFERVIKFVEAKLKEKNNV